MSTFAQLTTPKVGLQVQKSVVTAADLPLPTPVRGTAPQGLYIHVPFCAHKFHYCDFYSLVDARDRQERFTARLINELRTVCDRFTQALETIFVGGGTPTLLTPVQWTDLLAAIADHVPVADDLEFTVEANPETVNEALLSVLVRVGW